MQCVQTEDGGFDSQIGIYGWRKRCLYTLLLALVIAVLCNTVVTVLLLNALQFNLGGIGELTVLNDCVQLRDYSYMLDRLVTSQMSSRYGEPLSFESSYNLSLELYDDNGHVAQSLDFWSLMQEPYRLSVTAWSPQFRVQDLHGRPLFTVKNDRVSLGSDVLQLLEGEVQFSGSVQTPMLRSSLGKELMLESATRRLYLSATADVSIESRAADIGASCLTNLEFSSSRGKVKLKAPGIYIPSLETTELLQPQTPIYMKSRTSTTTKSYQVCMCSNGKLFVAQSDGECSVHSDGLQCR